MMEELSRSQLYAQLINTYQELIEVLTEKAKVCEEQIAEYKNRLKALEEESHGLRSN